MLARRLARAGFLTWLGLFDPGFLAATPAHAHDHIFVDVVLRASSCAPAVLRVWDGDTVRIGFGSGSERVRLAHIDAPEIDGQCRSEIERARMAQARLAELLRGRHLAIGRAGIDRHGRTLATLEVAGVDLGEILVAEGLARMWSGRRHRWCP
jgi:endonuclease YncB( thermonuclease family)